MSNNKETLAFQPKLKNFPFFEAESISRKIIDNAPLSIIFIDKGGFIRFANKYFKNLSASHSPVGKKIYNIPFFFKENLCPRYKELLREGKSFKKEGCRTINQQGEIKYLSITAVPIKDKRGHIEGALSMAVDMTETVTAKIELENLNLKLEKKIFGKTLQLRKINQKLSRHLKLKSRFISDASHELRTPLAIIKLNLDFAEKEAKKNKRFSAAFKAMGIEVEKIASILSDLSLITAIDEGREEFSTKHTDLIKIIQSACSRMRFFAKNKNIDIIEPKKKNFRIYADPEKMERLFTNLIKNAIKYGKRKGWIKITVWSLKDRAKITVSDNGIGIPKDDLGHIFDRFYRSNIGQSRGEGGFGLGLAVCKWIAEQHKGSISVKSVLGKGSSFTVCLPKNRSFKKE